MKPKKPKPGKKRVPKKRPAPNAVGESAAAFEEMLKTTEAGLHYSLRLYVTGSTARSCLAVTNIRALCDEYLLGRYDLEVVDIYQQPGQAAVDQIIAVPTLVKTLPAPPKRLVGNLADRDKVIVGLDLRAKQSPVGKKVKWAAV
jgi:circadian clock protein KaiB